VQFENDNGGPAMTCAPTSVRQTLPPPRVGDLELNYERLDIVLGADLTIFTYTADPGTPTAEGLALLGSLAATTNAETTAP
jgi:hypothetical protein